MYPYRQQIGLSHSFLIIKAPHLSARWRHHKLFVIAVICDPVNINVETLDTPVLWLRVWTIGVVGRVGNSTGIKCLVELQWCPWYTDVIMLGFGLHKWAVGFFAQVKFCTQCWFCWWPWWEKHENGWSEDGSAVNQTQVHFHDRSNLLSPLPVLCLLHQSREGSFLSHEARQD